MAHDHYDFRVIGVDNGDFAGASLASGDYNGDGVRDIAIGAKLADGNNNTRNAAGEVYVLFGTVITTPSPTLSPTPSSTPTPTGSPATGTASPTPTPHRTEVAERWATNCTGQPDKRTA